MTQASSPHGSVVELRRYRLHPGMRETLIDLFEREFIEPQEAAGMCVIGPFRDLDAPDEFVWLRGFPDMASRAEALRAFYTGPVWAAHKEAANRTMINSDNVLLLRPTSRDDGGAASGEPWWSPGSPHAQPGLVVATICSLAPRTEQDFASFFERSIRPLLARTSGGVLATFVTEHIANTFPRLPVREGETVFVWLSGFASVAAYKMHLAALAQSDEWTEWVRPEMDRRTWRPNEVARLVPISRSRLRG